MLTKILKFFFFHTRKWHIFTKLFFFIFPFNNCDHFHFGMLKIWKAFLQCILNFFSSVHQYSLLIFYIYIFKSLKVKCKEFLFYFVLITKIVNTVERIKKIYFSTFISSGKISALIHPLLTRETNHLPTYLKVMVSWFYHLIHICLSFLTACCVLMPGGRILIWQKRSGSDIWIWIRLKGSGSNIWIRTNKAGLYMKCTYCPSGKNSWHTVGVNCTILLLLLHLIKKL